MSCARLRECCAERSAAWTSTSTKTSLGFRGPAADWLFEVEEAVTPELRLGSDSDSDSESESESEPDSDRGSVRFGPSPSLKR